MPRLQNKISRFFVFLLVLIQTNVEAYDPLGDKFGEPQYTVIDRNNVNLASGTIYYHLPDVSIGSGELALTHSISITSNDLANLDSYIRGYKEKYRGGIRKRIHTLNLEEVNRSIFYTIYVSDHEISADFIITPDGKFESIGDKRLQLSVADLHHYVLTKPDGTRVYFYSKQAIPTPIPQGHNAYGSMIKIEYASGFVIQIHKDGDNIGSKITSVNSNNGLQLKYIYEVHNRPLDSGKNSIKTNPNVPADSLNWSSDFPAKIIALNNAVEICPIRSNGCTTINEWPTATYEWPDGMPRAFYIGKSSFSVTDAGGVTTEFHNTAFDTAEGNFWDLVGQNFIPRLARVENNRGLDISYSYENCENFNGPDNHTLWATEWCGSGILTEARNNGVKTKYYLMRKIAQTSLDSLTQWTSGGYKPVRSVVWPKYEFLYGDARVSVTTEIEAWNQTVYLDSDFANKVRSVHSKLDGTVTDYSYDAYGRLTETYQDGIVRTIKYPKSYGLPYTGNYCDNHRYCNKPIKISDYYEVGQTPNYTNYSYHVPSGYTSKVTHPKNSQGKNASTAYRYQQYRARYLDASGVLRTSTQPIWMMSSEFSCQNSEMIGSNCAGSDKVEITYHYGDGNGSTNLFLQGKTVTSQADNKSRTTCYKSDMYGNQIEESRPKSGISDCNIGREY